MTPHDGFTPRAAACAFSPPGLGLLSAHPLPECLEPGCLRGRVVTLVAGGCALCWHGAAMVTWTLRLARAPGERGGRGCPGTDLPGGPDGARRGRASKGGVLGQTAEASGAGGAARPALTLEGREVCCPPRGW